MMSSLLQKFHQLKSHEQLMLVGCAALVLLYLLYLLLWSPLTAQREQWEQRNQVAQESLGKVRQLAGEYQALVKSGAKKSGASRVNLSRIVDSSVASNGLAMRRYQPSANGGAQVRFENVAFNNLIGWIHEIETQHRVLIKDLSITKGSAIGLVNASIRLSQPN